jgi:hypothetical protein
MKWIIIFQKSDCCLFTVNGLLFSKRLFLLLHGLFMKVLNRLLFAFIFHMINSYVKILRLNLIFIVENVK